MQNSSDVAISAHECLGHPLDQRCGRIVRDEVNRQLARHESGASRLRDDQADCSLDLAESPAVNRVAEKSFAAEIMPGRIEFEGTAADIHSLHLGFQLGLIANVDTH